MPHTHPLTIQGGVPLADNEKKTPELPDGDGRYIIVNMIARRAREINKERVQARIFADEDLPDPMDIAANEYDNNLLEFEFHHHLVGSGDDFRSI